MLTRRALAGCAAVALASCSTLQPVLPPTQAGMPVSTLNRAAAGTAPAVLNGVNFGPIARARTEPDNWITYYGAYDAQRFSSVDKINVANIAKLRPAWVFQHAPMKLMAAHATYAFEATPIVVDGVMYLSGPDGYVWALDATTGRLLWQHQHAVPLDTPLCCGNINRGVAVANGKVFYATPDAHLIALDGVTGKVVWDRVFGNVRSGESATVAPLVVKSLVLVGASGGEYGVRGHIDAFELETGRRAWRLYAVPLPGEPGSETWGNKEAMLRGGGTTWITGSYDPELSLVYWGTGNPGPDFRSNLRPGANLFTDSVLAINPDTGQRVWHYQWTPHDVWDYDGVGENILFESGGRKLLAHADKNGYLFIIDRTNGQFVRAIRFAETTWGEIDPFTGRVTRRLEPTQAGTVISPGPSGAKEGFPHTAYSRQTGFIYIPTMLNSATYKTGPAEFREGLSWWGGDVETMQHQHRGALKAVDPASGREAWRWDSEFPVTGSVLATAGNLVFAGLPDGTFNAWNARTGQHLWSFQTGSGIHSSPITYRVNGVQYVAIPSGWGGWLPGIAPKMAGEPRGDALFVLALPSPDSAGNNRAAR